MYKLFQNLIVKHHPSFFSLFLIVCLKVQNMGMMSISDSNNDIYRELSKLIMIQGLVPSLAAMLLVHRCKQTKKSFLLANKISHISVSR